MECIQQKHLKMIIEQILGHIGNVFFVTGAIGFAQKHISGFYLNILGNGFYIWKSYLTNDYALGILSLILILINIQGIYVWTKKSNIK